jgi:hypothetical protein
MFPLMNFPLKAFSLNDGAPNDVSPNNSSPNDVRSNLTRGTDQAFWLLPNTCESFWDQGDNVQWDSTLGPKGPKVETY